MKVLVVGATGVVGRQLVPQLTSAGHRVVATSRSGRAYAADGDVVFSALDVLDGAAVSRVVRATRPDAIIHQGTALSGLSNNLRRFDALFAVTNRIRTEGTQKLITAAAEIGSPRLIVQSFCGWPWAQVGGPVKTEADPLDDNPPKSFRQTFAALQAMEAMVSAYPEGVALRYGGFYGPHTSLAPGGPHRVAVEKGRFPLVGNGAGVWSFVHVADAASAAVAALHRGRGIYNIVDDEPAPVSAWLPELARLAGGPPPKHVPTWLARLVGGEGLVRLMTSVRGSSNALARAELGWSPSFPSWREGFASQFVRSAATSPGSGLGSERAAGGDSTRLS